MDSLPSRNHPKGIGLAERVWKNFRFIETAQGTGEDVHVVTALVSALLGLLIIPQQKGGLPNKGDGPALDDPSLAEWPKWKIVLGMDETQKLGDLVWHVRNAVAHGHLEFFPVDGRDLRDITVKLSDKPAKGRINWQATLSGPELREFCERLRERFAAV